MKRILVEKYGGTSVGSVARLRAVARRIIAAQERGYEVVAVVSAMGDTTDELLKLADQVAPQRRHRELGMLLSTGEVISSSLLAMAIQSLGKNATSLTGSQSGISTHGIHTDARISNIDATYIKKLLAQQEIVVVAGYQGSNGDDIAVLGRGGSDASAVALAAALEAELCNIYTDVKGVYTADPRIVPNASLLASISYEEMIELAGSGAKVMMGRAVEIAQKYHLEIRVSSSFEKSPGTLITKENKLENVVITGIAVNKEVAIFNVYGLRTKCDYFSSLLNRIAEKKINIILLCLNSAGEKTNNISLLVKPENTADINTILKEFRSKGRIENYKINNDVAQISIVGSGIANNYGVANEMFGCLSQSSIDVLMTSTSEIKITAIIPKHKADRAMIELHNKFQLNNLQRNVREEQHAEN